MGGVKEGKHIEINPASLITNYILECLRKSKKSNGKGVTGLRRKKEKRARG